MRIDIESYRESLTGGLLDEQEIAKEIEEVKAAKVGTIKPNCWEKVSDTEIELYEL